MAEITVATADDVARYYGAIEFKSQWTGRTLRKGRMIAGFGGLLEVDNGVWLAFLEVPAEFRRPSIYRHIVAALQEAKAKGALVFKAKCDQSIPRSAALMEHLGFQPTDEVLDNEVVWACLASSF